MTPPLRRVEQLLARALAADLAGQPLYLIPLTATPAGRLDPDRCPQGWTGGLLDLEHRDLIGDRWRGRGPAAVVDERLPAADRMAVACHELAHRLDAPELYETVPDPLAPSLAALLVDESWRTRSAVKLLDSRPVDDQVRTHPPGWGRLALHLAHRVGVATGAYPQPRAVLAYDDWLGPYAHDLQRVVGDAGEFGRWAGRPLGWVKGQPLPAGFAALWAEAAAGAGAGAG